MIHKTKLLGTKQYRVIDFSLGVFTNFSKKENEKYFL